MSKEEKCNLLNDNGECKLLFTYDNLNQNTKLKIIIELFKKTWIRLTAIIMFVGLSLIFIGSIINIFIQDTTLSENQIVNSINLKIFDALQVWVSFGLGVTATLFSIISMYLSFYNLSQQQESEKETIKSNQDLKEDIVKEIKINLKELRKEMLEELNIIKDKTDVLQYDLRDKAQPTVEVDYYNKGA